MIPQVLVSLITDHRLSGNFAAVAGFIMRCSQVEFMILFRLGMDLLKVTISGIRLDGIFSL